MIPSIDSPLWQTLKVPETTRKSIIQRRWCCCWSNRSDVCLLVGWIGDFGALLAGTFPCKRFLFLGGTLIHGSHDICIFWWLLLKNGLDRRQFANDFDRRNLMKLFLLLSDANALKPLDYLNKKLAVASVAFLPNIFVWICSARCK